MHPIERARHNTSPGVGLTIAHTSYTAAQGHRAHVAALDYRLASKWGCRVGTAKARRERALGDVLDTLEACMLDGETERLGHYLSLFDAALIGTQGLSGRAALYAADRSDTEEDVIQCRYREQPSKKTAKAWFDALGRESRVNEPAMAALREEWDL